MAFRNQSRFMAAETRWVEDPFGAGARLEIAYIGCAEYQEWLRKNQSNSPLAQQMTKVLLGINTLNAAGAKLSEEERSRQIAAFVAASDVTIDITERDVDGIALLIRNWESGPGQGIDVPWSIEEARGLLKANSTDPTEDEPARPLLISDQVIKRSASDGVPDLDIAAGTPLGYATAEWVLWEAQQHGLYREDFVQQAEGN